MDLALDELLLFREEIDQPPPYGRQVLPDESRGVADRWGSVECL